MPKTSEETAVTASTQHSPSTGKALLARSRPAPLQTLAAGDWVHLGSDVWATVETDWTEIHRALLDRGWDKALAGAGSLPHRLTDPEHVSVSVIRATDTPRTRTIDERQAARHVGKRARWNDAWYSIALTHGAVDGDPRRVDLVSVAGDVVKLDVPFDDVFPA